MLQVKHQKRSSGIFRMSLSVTERANPFVLYSGGFRNDLQSISVRVFGEEIQI